MQTFSDPGAQRQTAAMPAVSTPLYDLGRYQQVRDPCLPPLPVPCLLHWLLNPLHIPWRSKRLTTSSVHSINRGCMARQTGVLGAGTFGVVVRAVDPDSLADCPSEVAIKLLPRGELLKNFKTYVTREILHQSCLEHPFIVSIKEVRTAGLAACMSFCKDAPGADTRPTLHCEPFQLVQLCAFTGW